MRFLIDTNLPRALCSWLHVRGHACRHVLELNLARSADIEIWRVAASSGEIIVSKDEDFADLVLRTVAGPSVVWVRTGNGTNRQLMTYLVPLWPFIERRLATGERLVEVR